MKEILIDAHIHTAEISPCSRVTAKLLTDICAEEGLGGFVLTNHYKKSAVRGDFADWRRRYVEEYERTRLLGDRKGLRVFFGVEFTLEEAPQNDFTAYGLPLELIASGEPLYTLTLSELSALAHSYGALLYHAHPYRNTHPADASYIDGVEINCHPLYRTCAEARVREFADAHHLRLSCGSDYHGDTYKPHCGMMIPDSVKTTEDLVAFMKNTPRPPLLIAPDPTDDTPMEVPLHIKKRLAW